jgi:CheY-like chemotaxis protein
MSRSAEIRINSSGTTELAVNQDGSVQFGDKIRILIADDHTSVLAGLSSIIGMQPDMVVVAEAENGRQAVELWHKQRMHAVKFCWTASGKSVEEKPVSRLRLLKNWRRA